VFTVEQITYILVHIVG